jgi:hypothetical protein
MKNTPSVSATLVRLRRRLTSALLVFGLTLGTIAMTAKPVDAAAAVLTCYTRQGAYPWAVSGYTVKLMGMSPQGQIREVALSTKTDASGCALFYVPLHYQGDYVWTIIEHFDVVFLNGYSYGAYYWWHEGQTLWNYGYAFAFPGDGLWYLPGTFWCEPSFPTTC